MPKKRAANRQTRQERRADRRKDKRGQGHDKPNFHDNENQPPRKGVKPWPDDKPIVPLTERQADYDDAFQTHKIVFGVGPAGTGKTWFAIMRASQALNRGEIDKIVLTRPAESAEEEMGHLPGELEEKYDPYLRPVKEALEEYFGTGHLEYLLRNKIVEAIPLGFMRGATLKNAWVIADEMQNATKGQIKMFLTRFGENAKFVVNGDPKQVDIDAYKSGLMDAVQRTAHIDAIKFIQFTKDDIVREGLVQEIVEAYEEA